MAEEGWGLEKPLDVSGGSETFAGLTAQEGSQDQGNHAQGQGKEGIHVA